MVVVASAGESGPAAGTTRWARLSNLLMQLRKCCDHPFLFPVRLPNASRFAVARVT
jgi:hypothetical protein